MAGMNGVFRLRRAGREAGCITCKEFFASQKTPVMKSGMDAVFRQRKG
jgi:hypothetical protein